MLRRQLQAWALLMAVSAATGGVRAERSTPGFEPLKTTAAVGVRGGQLVIAQRAEPKTLNPVMAVDAPSREVLRRLHADLIHIDRGTLATQPALARSWSVTPDGRHYTIALRRGLRFSDGHPCDADDVVFSFGVYLDEQVHSPQRDLLMVAGKPIAVRKIDPWTVAVDLPEAYAAGARLFDSVAVLPRHLLQEAYTAGTIAKAWGITTPASAISGLGPFRLAQYVPGERVVVERNPYYWKVDSAGQALPYLDRLTFVQVPDENAQAIRFRASETDLVTRLTADDYESLAAGQQQGRYRLYDLGPGLEYNFLFFNQNDLTGKNLPQVAHRQRWFRERAFRQAVSLAIDREAIVRLVYRGRGAPLWTHVTPANRQWINEAIPRPPRSADRARQTLRDARFSWGDDGRLRDARGTPVEFSILVAAGNQPRTQMATIIQEDLAQLGIRATVVSLEFRALLSRVLDTRDYDACVLGLGSGDADPSAEMNVWLSSGPTHLWNPSQREPATAWEAEVDDLDAPAVRRAGRPRAEAPLRPRAGDCRRPTAHHRPRQPRHPGRREPGAGQLPAVGRRPLRALERGRAVLEGPGAWRRPMTTGAAAARLLVPAPDRPSPAWPDDRLVRACLEGDDRAWNALIDKYKRLIYSIALKYHATPDDAADVFQCSLPGTVLGALAGARGGGLAGLADHRRRLVPRCDGGSEACGATRWSVPTSTPLPSARPRCSRTRSARRSSGLRICARPWRNSPTGARRCCVCSSSRILRGRTPRLR